MLVIDTSKTQWCDAEHNIFNAYVRDVDGWHYVTCCQYSNGIAGKIWDMREELDIIPADDEMTYEAVCRLVDIEVQGMIDRKAQEKRYHDGAWLAGYATSTDSEFHADAQKFIAWRDRVWRKCYEIQEAYLSGQMERLPTVAEVMAQLPEMEW